jgi:solute carrier family 15 (oligopeptide transporter), member 1
VIVGFVISIIGNGCMKANINTFGGNQHKLPEQAKQLQMFFSLQYWAVKWGSLLARIVFPTLRHEVKCFGNNDCFSAIFAVASTVMFTGLIAFLLGNSHYKHVKSNGNMLIRMFKCIRVS